jgi:hypothetical protein
MDLRPFACIGLFLGLSGTVTCVVLGSIAFVNNDNKWGVIWMIIAGGSFLISGIFICLLCCCCRRA